MAGPGSGKRRSKGLLLDTLDNLTYTGLWAGGAAFVLVSVYLLYGILTGRIGGAAALPAADRARVISNILFSCKALGISGIVLIISTAIRFYNDEITGYCFLIVGALLEWGTPMLIGSSLYRVSLEAAKLPIFIVSQFKTVGIIALATAVPFVVYDFWLKMRGIRRALPKTAVVIGKEDDLPRSRLYIFCWQMPYCRNYLRKFCKAHEQKKSCWRIKSGCYCDEGMILRVMKESKTVKIPGFDQRFSEVAGGGGARDLTAAQKRQRCRQCFLYQEHQKQKYRMLSPLAFPITGIIMWLYFKPAQMFLSKALEITDQLAGRISYGSGSEQVIANQWANAHSTSETVLWLFLACIGLVLVTYILRGLEYCIFDLQV
jgi:hypothetical protein